MLLLTGLLLCSRSGSPASGASASSSSSSRHAPRPQPARPCPAPDYRRRSDVAWWWKEGERGRGAVCNRIPIARLSLPLTTICPRFAVAAHRFSFWFAGGAAADTAGVLSPRRDTTAPQGNGEEVMKLNDQLRKAEQAGGPRPSRRLFVTRASCSLPQCVSFRPSVNQFLPSSFSAHLLGTIFNVASAFVHFASQTHSACSRGFFLLRRRHLYPIVYNFHSIPPGPFPALAFHYNPPRLCLLLPCFFAHSTRRHSRIRRQYRDTPAEVLSLSPHSSLSVSLSVSLALSHPLLPKNLRMETCVSGSGDPSLSPPLRPPSLHPSGAAAETR